jgi:hypothetical protein
LTDSNGRHSGGKKAKLLFDLSNGGSLAVTLAVCGVLSCASSYFAVPRLLLRKHFCSTEEVPYTDVQTKRSVLEIKLQP